MLYRYRTEAGVVVEFESDVVIPQGHGFMFQVPEAPSPEPVVDGGGGPGEESQA